MLKNAFARDRPGGVPPRGPLVRERVAYIVPVNGR